MRHRSILFAAGLLLASAASAQAASPRRAAPAPAPAGSLGDIQLTQIRLDDAARLLSQVGKANVVVTGKVAEQVVSLYLRNATVEDMVKNLCRAAGVWYRFDTDSRTYVIMSGDEYQKDLAIVRDEKTRVFTLRHHNVVATANSVKALFGGRVVLATPVEEMPPTSLGSGTRTTTGGNKGSGGSGNRSGSGGGTSSSGSSGTLGGTGFDVGQQTGSGASLAGGTGNQAAAYDPTADLKRLSQDRLAGQVQLDAHGRPILGIADVQDMAARQGPPIYVTYNKLNNLLMVRSGDDVALKQIAEFVKEVDRPPRQVLLEMKVLEVTLDDGFRSAFDIGIAGKSTTSILGLNDQGQTVTNTGGRNILSSGRFDAEQDATFIWQAMSKNLSFRFQLLAEQNKLKVLSSPMVVAANNQPARLFIGDERVLTVGASSQSVTGTTGATNTTITVETEKRDVGQTLSILPRINGDRSVSLTIDQDSSTVKLKDTSIPIATATGSIIDFPIDTVNTATLQVTAHARDGMTVAVGGMISERLQRDEEKVPMLGDVPVLGTLFKRDLRSRIRSQIVLLITPRVLESAEEADSLARGKEGEFDALGNTVPTQGIPPRFGRGQPASSATRGDPGQGEDSRLAALARSAATAVRQPDPTLPPPEGLQPAHLPHRNAVRLANDMEAKPAASWQRDGYHVTALQVTNLSPVGGNLATSLIPGRWAAVVVEKTRLDGAGSANSWTWAYAISREPYAQATEAGR